VVGRYLIQDHRFLDSFLNLLGAAISHLLALDHTIRLRTAGAARLYGPHGTHTALDAVRKFCQNTVYRDRGAVV
jgi:hypothetical protein